MLLLVLRNLSGSWMNGLAVQGQIYYQIKLARTVLGQGEVDFLCSIRHGPLPKIILANSNEEK